MPYTLDRESGPLAATDEQTTIIDAALRSRDNLLIDALAGAAKTTTLEFICKYVQGIPILSLAFNKRIADEMSKRLPSHVECKTLNALGHRVWAQATGRRLIVDTDKTANIVKELINEFKPAERGDLFAFFGDVIKAVGWAKTLGYIPDGVYEHAKRLATTDEFHSHILNVVFEDDPPQKVFRLIRDTLIVSIKRSYDGVIDFSDQLYMPTLFGGTFPSFPLVLVDEAQDLSPLNHEMLRKLARTRLIAVGDPYQSIYAFRGAVSNGMDALQSTFAMRRLGLSVSFRCPKAVIRRAQRRVPHMKWPEWAKEGTVEYLASWGAENIPDGAAIICRNNAPLLRIGFRLLAEKRGIKMLGSDIGPGMVKTLKKLGDLSMDRASVHKEINSWETLMLSKGRNVGAISDKAECLRVFADEADTLGGAVAFAEHIFKVAGPIQLMSGHKSKGLEYEIVFHLDPGLIRRGKDGEDGQQELNVEYVIETRAKEALYLINSEDFQ